MTAQKEGGGLVYLVGAGPGAPGLITVEGLSCIKRSDVIVYDRLIPQRLLSYARPGTELIFAGKKPGCHQMKQEDINKLLAEKASQGLKVTRLKGGDPFVFGRGGEEAAHLEERGIPFSIVPGVTAAVAVPAYAGIPVTHRGLASEFTVVTGHEDPAKFDSGINWRALAGSRGTKIFLMGMGNLALIMEKLVAEGLSPSTPVALISEGTTSGQQVLQASVETAAARAAEHGFKPPAVIVVGEVARLRDRLAWVEKRPLFGKRIVVTRAREQASVFAEKLENLGAEVTLFPVIKIIPPADTAPLDRAIGSLPDYSWAVFTSVNGVEYFFERMKVLQKDIRCLKGIKLCAIGPVTAEALTRRGLILDAVPEEYRAEAAAEAMRGKVKKGDRILLPRAEEARSALPEMLQEMGAITDQVTAYRTQKGLPTGVSLGNMIAGGDLDMITFTSSSTVRNLKDMLEPGLFPLPDGVALASIGPITSATASDLGLNITVEANRYTIDGLVEAIVKYYNGDAETGHEYKPLTGGGTDDPDPA